MVKQFFNFFFGIWYLLQIIFSKKSRANYYFVELNPFHTECLYSAYKYVHKASKKSVIFTTRENVRLNIFNKSFNIFSIYPTTIKILDFFHFFNKSNLIFAGSYFVWLKQKKIEYFFLNYLKTGKPLLSFDHAPEFHNSSKSEYPNVHQLVLADFLSKIYNLPAVYPVLFPETAPFSKPGKQFLSVGVIGDQNRRDMNLYLSWLENNPSVHSYIVSSNIYKQYIPRLKSLSNIQIYEKASFKDLFRLCKESTFIPFLIHNKNLGYYNTAISGNLNLALAFQIIPIIDSRLAKLYGFTTDNSIIYNGESDCINALDMAVHMPEKEILYKRNSLKHLYEQKIQNSSKTINTILDSIHK